MEDTSVCITRMPLSTANMVTLTWFMESDPDSSDVFLFASFFFALFFVPSTLAWPILPPQFLAASQHLEKRAPSVAICLHGRGKDSGMIPW